MMLTVAGTPLKHCDILTIWSYGSAGGFRGPMCRPRNNVQQHTPILGTVFWWGAGTRAPGEARDSCTCHAVTTGLGAGTGEDRGVSRHWRTRIFRYVLQRCVSKTKMTHKCHTRSWKIGDKVFEMIFQSLLQELTKAFILKYLDSQN